jgi:hypothetical protein
VDGWHAVRCVSPVGVIDPVDLAAENELSYSPAATSNSSTRGRVKLLHLTGQQDVVKLA